MQEALSCYKQGISLPEARFHVGRCYDYGIGTAQNKVLALKWYKQARQQSTGSKLLLVCSAVLFAQVVVGMSQTVAVLHTTDVGVPETCDVRPEVSMTECRGKQLL